MFATLLEDIGTVTPVVATITGIAVAYLRLFMKNQLHDMKTDIYSHLDMKYFGRDIVDLRLRALEQRLAHLEDALTIKQLNKLP